MAAALVVTVVTSAATVVGPLFLGWASDAIFRGWLGRTMPQAQSLAAAIAQAESSGDQDRARLLRRMHPTPGMGVDFGHLAVILAFAAGSFVLAALLLQVQGLMIRTITVRVSSALRLQVQEKLDRLPMAYFDTRPRGDILSRVTADVDNVGVTLHQGLSYLLVSICNIVGITVMMVLISPLLAAVAVAGVAASALLSRRLAARTRPLFAAQSAATGDLAAYAEDCLTGHETIELFGHQEYVLERFNERNRHLAAISLRAADRSWAARPLVLLATNASFVLLSLVGGLFAIRGRLSVGQVQAILQYARQYGSPINIVTALLNQVQAGLASAERVFELLDATEEKPDPLGVLPDVSPLAVDVREVSFAYADGRTVLADVSFHAEPGQSIALVGPTGAGKTTLANLLLGFYEPTVGRVEVGDIDIGLVSRRSLRSRVGVVLQEPWLLSGTVAENIAFDRHADGYHAIRAAAQDADAGFVEALPDGYATKVDADAVTLSAGERQLITIARAFFAQPAVLVLDEATSSVDTRTEARIRQATIRLRAQRTSIVIAHRLSTIRHADLILVLDQGRIVERGTHDELIGFGGLYARMIDAQRARPTESTDLAN